MKYVLAAVLFAGSLFAQTFAPVDVGSTASFRGLSVVDGSTVWISGTGGTILRTNDNGKKWLKVSPPDSDKLDFRDIEGFSSNLAYALAAGPGDASRIYKTNDGGRHWILQLTDPDPKGFYDCMAFWDADHGVVLGDPIDGRFQILTTTDGGSHWNLLPRDRSPEALPGEGAFAASGQCVAVQGKSNAWFGTGGAKVARVFRSADGGQTWAASETPMAAGTASAGVFAVAFRDSLHGIAVGGDYKNPSEATNTAAITGDGGLTWRKPNESPRGYRSSVISFTSNSQADAFAVGSNGVDVSNDGGRSWKKVQAGNYNSIAAHGQFNIWIVGQKGTVMKLASR